MDSINSKFFDDILYIDENHSYWHNDEKFISVTQFLSQFKQPFDTDRWSKHSAKKEGISQQTILERWDAKGKISLEKGTIVHNAAEVIIKGLEIDLNGMPSEVLAVQKFWKHMVDKYAAKMLQVEWVIGDKKAKIAGRIDALIEFCHNGKTTKSLLDWKTGTVKLKNHYEKMKPPFHDIDDCSLNHYSIQLSLYRLIIERNLGIKLGHGILINLLEDGSIKPLKAKDYRGRLDELIFKD